MKDNLGKIGRGRSDEVEEGGEKKMMAGSRKEGTTNRKRGIIKEQGKKG